MKTRKHRKPTRPVLISRASPYGPRAPRLAVDDAVTFTPSAFIDTRDATDVSLTLHGRVVYINEAHRFYVAEAECNGHRLREAFKF